MGTPRDSDADDPSDSSDGDSLLAEIARAPSVEVPSLRVGSTIGRYRLDAVLGQGGMGVVYRAHDTRLNRTVALKLVRDELLGDPSRKARLLREARAAAALTHANVVATYDAGEDGGLTYLAMELIEGETLRARLANGSLPIADALAIGRGIAAALAAAHVQRVLHRDLKPDNVMLGDGGVVKVLDFGLAKSLASDDADIGGATTVTAEGVIAGTPAYMSPEQLEGRELDARSDVFAFGVVLYEMLAGARPFKGDTNNAVIASILRDTPKPLVELRSETPHTLVELIDECLAKKRDARPASGEALVDRLASVDVTALATRAHRAPARVRRWPALALVGACVIGLGGLMFVRSRASSGAQATAPSPSASAMPPLSLSDNDSVLACPQLEATGIEEPQGWLGAAAAEIVCRRALWMLGGKLERVVWPAALLDLPKLPTDDFPSDPYGAPGARDRAIGTAKRRANIYLDGTIAREGDSFSTRITLRRVDGVELAAATGHGRLLHEAMKSAIADLERTGALPHAHVVDPEFSRWAVVKSVDVLLAYDDDEFAWAPQAESCAFFTTHREQLLWGGADLATICPGLPSADSVSLAPVDDERPGEYLTSVNFLAFQGSLPAPEAALRTIDALARRANTAWAQNVIAGTREALLRAKGDIEGANAENMKVLAATPADLGSWRNAIGMGGSSQRLAAAVAFSAWLPSYGAAWSTRSSLTTDEAAIPWARRAHLSGNLHTNYGFVLADRLFRAGKLEEVRALAASYPDDTEGHRVSRQVLLARISGTEGRLGEAFARVRTALDALTTIVGDDAEARTPAILFAAQLGQILGKPAEWADRLVQRLILPIRDPVWLLRNDRPTMAALICLHASKAIASVCVRHLEAVTAQAVLEWTYGGKPLFAGVKRYVAGDLRGAVAAWRPMLAGDGMQMLQVVPVEIFDAAGEPDLAERIDLELAKRASFNGISAALPRMAKRALARGDKARARELAQKVIDAWSVADVPIPAVDEMRKLLLRAQ